ncbi:MAG: glycosyltransferase [Patescibacteria group bacterium]
MSNAQPKIAIIHDYLNAYGGQEDVTNAIWEMYPNAPIYTALWDPTAFEGTGAFKGADIRVPKWATTSFVNKFYKYFTFLYPILFETTDLSEFDIVISSSANFAKGVVTRSDQLHISYIHTPPRFLWGYPTETAKRDKWYWRIILNPLDSFLRIWDYNASQRPDFLLCNSTEVRGRIKKFYGRDAKIIHPFLTVKEGKSQNKTKDGEEYYLVVTRISRYKHVDNVILACEALEKNLIVAGSGKEFDTVKALADEVNARGKCKVQMLGFVPEEKKAELLKSCQALIYNVEYEDFGIAPLEAMYFGKPCIVPNQGGFKDTVKDSYNGVFSMDTSVESLKQAILKFESIKNVNWDKNCQETAKNFTKEIFQQKFREFVEEKWKSWKK